MPPMYNLESGRYFSNGEDIFQRKEQDMLEAQLEQAASSSKQVKERIIHELASQPNDGLEVALQVLNYPKKPLWEVAVQLIRAIGYPKNARAIPTLIAHVGDLNSLAWQEAVEALVEMGSQVVVPYLIQDLWERNRHQYWGADVEGICTMLCQVDKEYAVQCGPTIAYLLGRTDLPDNLDGSLLLDVLQKVGPDCAEYALPTLIDLVHHQERSELHSQIKELISSFAHEALEPYKYVLASV